jgi:23S rRNA pseudouridine955/2504/2580 synthase
MPPDKADTTQRSGVRHLEVSPEEDGQKLLQFLARRLGSDVPGSLLMRLIRSGQVRVDSARKKPFDRLRAGQSVRLPPLRVADPAPVAPDAPALAVLARGPGWIAVAKPAGLPSQPGTGHTDAASTRLAAMFPAATFTPTPAHRLDRDTSGILLAGTSYQGLRGLQRAFADHSLRKFYLARVHGRLTPGRTLVLSDTLAKTGGEQRQRVSPTPADAGGKPALALARCLESGPETALLELDLRTGRTHQLRVQLASRGLPIVGDRKYGRPDAAPRMMLHAWKIILPDGATVCLEPDW